MNLKERGITIGDLLILIIALVSIFTFLKIKESKRYESSKLNFVLFKSAHKIDLDQNCYYL